MHLGLDPNSEMVLAVVTIVILAVLISISYRSLMWLIKTWIRENKTTK